MSALSTYSAVGTPGAAVRGDYFVHGRCEAQPGPEGTDVILVGKLVKKSRWRGKWQVRTMELHRNNALHIFLGNKLRSTIGLGDGSFVRQVNDVGYGRKFIVRCGQSGRVLQLEAANVETRDIWAYHLQRVIAGTAATPAPPPSPLPAPTPQQAQQQLAPPQPQEQAQDQAQQQCVNRPCKQNSATTRFSYTPASILGVTT